MDSSARLIDPLNQKNPLHPDQTSVSVARRCEHPPRWGESKRPTLAHLSGIALA
jgi:hypothetical protein